MASVSAKTEITVNLLQQSNATPTVLAYDHLSPPFVYNKTPLAPMECAVQISEKTDKRGTWAYHSVDGCMTIHLLPHCVHLNRKATQPCRLLCRTSTGSKTAARSKTAAKTKTS